MPEEPQLQMFPRGPVQRQFAGISKSSLRTTFSAAGSALEIFESFGDTTHELSSISLLGTPAPIFRCPQVTPCKLSLSTTWPADPGPRCHGVLDPHPYRVGLLWLGAIPHPTPKGRRPFARVVEALNKLEPRLKG